MESFCLPRVDDEFGKKDMKMVIVNDAVYGYALGSPTRIGGAERQQWLLARALVKAGWAVTVGVYRGLEKQKRIEVEGVHFVGIGTGHFLWACHRFLRSERPDWWYWRAHDLWLGPAVQIARLSGVRTIFAAAFDSDMDPRRALYRRPKWWPLYAWGLAKADRIFAQHGGQLSQVEPQWRHKAYIVPSLVEAVSPVPSHVEHKPYVAWVGTLRQPKRADLLRELAQRATDTRFVVCGGMSHHRSSLEYGNQIVEALQALPNVEFLGQVEPSKAQQVIAEASVLLSTSDGEGFPNTFLEAWANGTPVVSLTIDPDRIIEQHGLGTVSGNVQTALKDMKVLMASSAKRKEIAKRAKAYVAERHGPETVIKIFESAIVGVGDT